MDRQAFLTRVRQAALVGRAYRPHVQTEFPPGTGYVGGGDRPLQRLAEEVASVGGQPQIVATLDDARQALADLFQRYVVKTALCWRHPVLDRLGLAELLAERGIAHLHHETLAPLDRPRQREIALSADIGVTSVSHAVAETGTLAFFSGPGQERMASLVPPVHVAIITADQVLPDLFDLFQRLPSAALPTNVALVTGPSKTGDIELRLTTGVHGPGQWHVILVA